MRYSKEFLKEKGINSLPNNWDLKTEAKQVKWISKNYPIVFDKIFQPENIINWSELSRFLNKGDRNGIRKNNCPDIHEENVRNLIKAVRKWQKSIQY